MASKNKVDLIGNLGRDPEVRTFPSGDIVANLTLATTDRWRDKNTGEKREHTEWHRIVLNGRWAEIARDSLRKGAQINVEGSLRTRKWTDQTTGQDRYVTEIRGDFMRMLGNRQDSQQRENQAQAPAQNQQRGNQAQAPAQNQQRGHQASTPYSSDIPPSAPMDTPPSYPPSAMTHNFGDLDDDIPM